MAGTYCMGMHMDGPEGQASAGYQLTLAQAPTDGSQATHYRAVKSSHGLSRLQNHCSSRLSMSLPQDAAHCGPLIASSSSGTLSLGGPASQPGQCLFPCLPAPGALTKPTSISSAVISVSGLRRWRHLKAMREA